VTDRLRATRKRSSGPGRLILTLQRIGTYPPSLPSRPARLRCRSRHGRGSTARGAQGMGQWAPPHHPVRPRPHQAQPGSPLPGRPRCATAAVPARVRQPDPRCPGSHSGPRPSDGTRSATRSVVASAPMTEARQSPGRTFEPLAVASGRPRDHGLLARCLHVAGPGGRPEPQCSARAKSRVGHACGCTDQLFGRGRTAMPAGRDKHQAGRRAVIKGSSHGRQADQGGTGSGELVFNTSPTLSANFRFCR